MADQPVPTPNTQPPELTPELDRVLQDAAGPKRFWPRDDRGQPFALPCVGAILKAAEGSEGYRSVRALRLRAALASSRAVPDLRGKLLLTALAGTAVGPGVLTWLLRSPPQPAWLVSMLCFWVVFGFGGPVLARRLGWLAASKEIVLAAVTGGLCGSCAYPLTSARREADGCAICPESGAAWKAARMAFIDKPIAPLYEPPWWRRLLLVIPRSASRMAPDDLGRFVRILDPRLELLAPQRRAEWGRMRVRAVRSRLRSVGFGARLLWSGLFAAFGAVLGVLVFNEGIDPPSVKEPFAAIIGALALLSIGFAFVLLRSSAYAGPRRVTPILLELALCPCCGRSLGDVPQDIDGFKTCPECGAAWWVLVREWSASRDPGL